MTPYIEIKNGLEYEIYADHESCKHRGCLHHISHPCEYCGRINGNGIAEIMVTPIKKPKEV